MAEQTIEDAVFSTQHPSRVLSSRRFVRPVRTRADKKGSLLDGSGTVHFWKAGAECSGTLHLRTRSMAAAHRTTATRGGLYSLFTVVVSGPRTHGQLLVCVCQSCPGQALAGSCAKCEVSVVAALACGVSVALACGVLIGVEKPQVGCSCRAVLPRLCSLFVDQVVLCKCI